MMQAMVLLFVPVPKQVHFNIPSPNSKSAQILAVTDATKEEIAAAATRRGDGSKAVTTTKLPYRPKLSSIYTEPAPKIPPDMLEEVMNTIGTVYRSRIPLELHDNNIYFDQQQYGATLQERLN